MKLKKACAEAEVRSGARNCCGTRRDWSVEVVGRNRKKRGRKVVAVASGDATFLGIKEGGRRQ